MDLMALLPDYYSGNLTMEELQGLIGVDTGLLYDDLAKTIDQCFVQTATELLGRLEKMYGLKVDVNKSYEFRRERIIAKIRGIGTVTKQMVVDTAASYSNGEVAVIENPSEYSFRIKFVGTRGIPANMDDLETTLNEIKPAHLSFSFEYTYLTWNEFDSYNKSWDEWDALNLTWDEFETYREVI